jgi:ABC-type phosphate/phosphonate transport system substrate-binding protein/rhodanese-related sulfurtransferase
MRKVPWILSLVLALLGSSSWAGDSLLFNVTLDYDRERDNAAVQSSVRELADELSKALGRRVQVVLTQNAERVGERVRTGTYAALLAPSQLVGLAMRHGYTPVVRTQEQVQVDLMASKASGVTSLDGARGKSIVLPHPESLVSYMVRGEMNALGKALASHFGQVMYMNKYGAVLYAMEIGQADVVAVKTSLSKDWLAQHPGVRVIKSLPVVPEAGVAVSDKLDAALKEKIRSAFLHPDQDLAGSLKRLQFGEFVSADKADFELVSTRGFFSPEVLPGATIVSAAQVKQLMAQGVPLFDVRPHVHYLEAHIPGAVNVPYQMNSPKEVDYDDAVDAFDLSKLPKDKNAPMIFQCNGAECWYSYKAARYMVKRGFKKVYWFRTGLPAWKAAGYPVESGK